MTETHQTHRRRVVDTAEEDVWKRIEDEAETESYGADSIDLLKRKRTPEKKRKKKKAPQKKKQEKKKAQRDMSPEGVRKRYQKRQKARRRFAARVRAVLCLVAAAIAIAAVLLATPLFDIRSISVSGNTLVSAEEVSEVIGDVKGTNLFLAKKDDIEKRMQTLKYINSVTVTKSLIPPSIDLFVTEHTPAGYIQSGSALLILDKDLYIIEAGGDYDTSALPCIIGIKIKKSETQSELIPENADVGNAAKTMLDILQQCGETGNVISADFSNMSNITFNYQNRITGICGTQLNLDKKLRLFCETVKNEEIGPDARGTIDLSKTGNAIYDP